VTEAAAIAASKLVGRGNERAADQAAVEGMREALNQLEFDGTIVIGEGERDQAPMLYIGEKVGAPAIEGVEFPDVDIAVDPLEGTNLCATGSANAIAVLAASEHGGLLHAPDCYMEKLIVGPSCKGAVELDAPVVDNLTAIAKRLERDIEDLVVMVLDRPRHEKLIHDIRAAGARIKLISDGDLSAGIAAAVIGTGVHAVMGIGGAPEGVITAAAMRCLNGEILARLVIDTPELEARIAAMGIRDKNKIYRAEDLAPGKHIIFAATGVTDGSMMRGVRFFGEGTRTSSLIMTADTGKVRFIETIHLEKRPDVKVRFW
jgi:fructose-1,6-bisphosphatase class II